MGIRALGNNSEDFVNKFLKARGGDSTGLDAVNPYVVPTLEGLQASGGVVSDYNTPPGAVYRAHIFTSTGVFDVSTLSTNPDLPDTVDYLIIGGGGGVQ